MVVLGERRSKGVVGERLCVWGWLVMFALSAGLLWVAWSGSHGQPAMVGGRVVTDQEAAARAGRDALARGAAADGQNDPLACYFSDPGPAYLSCGPVILDGSLHKGWDNFTLSVQPVGDGVRVEPVDGTVMVGPLPVGTRLVSGGGVLSRVGGDQLPHNVMYSTGAGKAGFAALGFGVLWAFASGLSSGSRRNRKATLAAGAVDRARTVSARQAWDSIGSLALAPPVAPPVPVFREAPPPALVDSRAVDAETGEILDSSVEANETAFAGSVQVAGPASAAVGVEQLSMPVTGSGDLPAEGVWSGPAVLVLGGPLLVGAVVEPDRKVVVELAAYLVCHRDGSRSAEQIQAALWPLEGSKGDVSLDTVRQHLSRLRRCVGEENLADAAKAGGYRFGDGVGCDWLRFQALAEAARRTEGVRSAALRRDALALVRGAPFAGVAKGSDGWAWEELIVAAMEAAIADVAHRLAVESLADGQPRVADWAAGRGLLAVPTDETLLVDRMAAAREMGGRPGLDRAWRDAKAVLGEQAESGPLADVYAELAGK